MKSVGKDRENNLFVSIIKTCQEKVSFDQADRNPGSPDHPTSTGNNIKPKLWNIRVKECIFESTLHSFSFLIEHSHTDTI